MKWPTKRALVRWWRPFRVLAGFVLLGVACWVVAGKSSELSGISSFLSQPHWEWLVPALAVETVSYLALALLQRALLQAGDTVVRLARVSLVTFASNAIQSALPVGAGFAALYQFGQYQAMGADDVLAGWVVIATAGVLFVTVSALAGLGLAMAASTGSTFDLVEAILGVIVVALLASLIWNRRADISRFLVRTVAGAETLLHRRVGQLSGPLEQGLARMRSVAPTKREWARALGLGSLVWLADCSCWMFAFLAVGARVPWQGLLLAYCAGQLAAILPITPGGLGVVEGTLTVALVAFVPQAGGPETVAAVLVYRVVSFWLPLPVGAFCYAALLRARRRVARGAQAAPAAPVVTALPVLGWDPVQGVPAASSDGKAPSGARLDGAGGAPGGAELVASGAELLPSAAELGEPLGPERKDQPPGPGRDGGEGDE